MKKLTPVLIAALLAIPPLSALALVFPEGRPLTVGHRGTTRIEDENTLEAYRAAAKYGLDVFECDPRLTKDGVYVIMHDSDVSRTTDGSGQVAEMTLSQIKALRTKAGHQVPTLAEALALARELDMMVYLDIKEPPPGGGAKLIALVREAGMADRVIAGCYHLSTLRLFVKNAPEIFTCVSCPYPVSMLGAKLLGADMVGTLTQLASPAMISMAHKIGLKVITMPINETSELEKFRARGLDALQSDDPRLLEPFGRGRRP